MVVAELARQFGLSHETIRRDLASIGRTMDLQKLYGGALLRANTVADVPFLTRPHTANKARLGELATRLVPNHGVVWLDGGTTVASLAKHLKAGRDLSVASHSIAAISNLAANPGFAGRVILPGGDVDLASQVVLGVDVHRMAEQMMIDVAFLGTNFIDASSGCYTKTSREAQLKALLARRSHSVVLVAESRKVGTVRGAQFLSWEETDYWVTDDGLQGDVRDAVVARGTRILTPGGPEGGLA